MQGQQTTPKPLHVRWMIARDRPMVQWIEWENFEFPWTEDDFIRCLRQRNVIGMVCEHGERIVGFMVYELVGDGLLRLLNLAVASTHQRRGVGRYMVRKLIDKLTPNRRKLLSVEVRETNVAAQLFFKALGLKATKTLRDFYDDTEDAAILMEYRHPLAPAEAAPVRRVTKLSP